MYRYYKFAETKYKAGNYLLLYLTLDGHTPKDSSLNGEGMSLKENTHYFCISYAHDIKEWLQQCHNASSTKPIVRETITQYYDLIIKLTNQNMEKMTEAEISSLFNSKDDFKAVHRLHKSYGAIMNKMLNTIFMKQMEDMARKLEGLVGEKVYAYGKADRNWYAKYHYPLYFKREGWEKLTIAFQFQGDNMRNMIYGIAYQNENKTGLPTDEAKVICQKTGWQPINNNWWVWYDKFTTPDWDNDEAIDKIYDGGMKNEIRDKVKELLDLTKGLDM